MKNIYLRPVTLKAGPRIACTFRYQTRDEVKNFTAGDAALQLETLLGDVFLNAELFTADADVSLAFSKNNKAVFSTKKPTSTNPPDTRHDREKHRLLDPAAPWLHALGITSKQGQVLPTAQDKWKQINKYLEIIGSLLRTHSLPTDARIADMGSGKGYLTFALYDFFDQPPRAAPPYHRHRTAPKPRGFLQSNRPCSRLRGIALRRAGHCRIPARTPRYAHRPARLRHRH
ncbi:MAG: methyltransferase [Lewinellaceae bacterium]|nr:methyltransferase [Lewinellaceae bacterium]